jgi:hypothetical protein
MKGGTEGLMNCYGQYAGDPAQRNAAYVPRMSRLEGREQTDTKGY